MSGGRSCTTCRDRHGKAAKIKERRIPRGGKAVADVVVEDVVEDDVVEDEIIDEVDEVDAVDDVADEVETTEGDQVESTPPRRPLTSRTGAE